MFYTYDDQTYSDLHKDAYGYRPRDNHWNCLTPVGKQIKWDSVLEDLDLHMEQEAADEAVAVEQFEAHVSEVVSLGGGSVGRDTAIRWIVEGLDLSSDDIAHYGGEYVCYKLGLPFHMQGVFDLACEDILRYELNDDFGTEEDY